MNGHLSEDQLALYVGHDLSREDQQQAAAHLDTCEDCRTALVSFELVGDMLRNACPELAEFELGIVRQGLRERLNGKRRNRRNVWRWSAAAVAATLTIVALVHRQEPSPAPVPVNTTQKAALKPPKMSTAPAPAPVVVPERPKRHIAHLKMVKRDVGIREATLITQADRPAQLRLMTADPSVVVFVQLNERN